MRVTEVSAHPVWAGSRNFLFVVVDTDEGVSGGGAGPATLGGRPTTPLGGPGLGIEFDRDAAAGHPPRWTEPPHLRRGDGSFTNW
jgi:L-alanine-DL-glutamate epimerase-like enolase superfamily enzyme